ncbi:MAG: STAS domain-containing protein [Spirochaetaceae bacterium]|jgi:anti-anti-sigma factor|nr:STAS domain-containing protein [Spirochaetaceae bacterium]
MTNNDIIPNFDDDVDDSLKITLNTVEGIDKCLILYLAGYIDTYNSNIFQKRITRIIERGYNRLIFQCEGLNYVSSTGIGSFTVFLKSVKPRGGDVILLEIQPKVFEVFHLLGFSQFFNIQKTLEEALDYFREEGAASESDIFPKVFDCPICSKKLKAIKPGRFRCSQCKAILALDTSGQVFLG